MLKLTKKDKRTELEKEIDDVIHQMNEWSAETEQYSKMADQLLKLYEAKSHERQRQVSADTLAVIAGNLIGIGLILNFEKLDIITSKALGFVLRGRV